MAAPVKKITPVVGIGASAGGLAALRTFFSLLPERTGIVFVVVVHLSPHHKSHFAELLQPVCKMPVQQINETLPLEVDHVYIIPPGRHLSAVDTHLRLSDPHGDTRGAIDHFFRTLAHTFDGSSIAVILSGTGSDGTLGVREVKAKGGMVMVQDPADAEFTGMPRSAAATGVADLILPLREMPASILRLADVTPDIERLADVTPDIESVLPATPETQEPAQILRGIFALLHARTGRDFGGYKHSTILRRIARRMQLSSIAQMAKYADLLRDTPKEVKALSDDLLVTVTSFFRDPQVFDKLAKETLPRLFENTTMADDVRVWSMGCATGEEAYSLTMLLLDEAARRDDPPAVQVFATDLHEASLQTAREGFYTGEIEGEVGGDRMSRYFRQEDHGYRIRKDVRESIIFAQHNVLADPPFSRLDLISCRNVLIYLQREKQHNVFELFHYALKPGGILLLGSSETAGLPELFVAEDKKLGIYRKRNVRPSEPRLPIFPATRLRAPGEAPAGGQTAVPFGALHQKMVERYALPSLLVTADDKVAHVSGHAGRYLSHPGGELTASVLKLVREELRMELRAALHDARHQRRGVRSAPVALQVDGAEHRVSVDVHPAWENEHDGFVLVAFYEHPQPVAGAGGEAGLAGDQGGGAKEQHLAAEIDLARQRLEAVVEQHETSKEEMKASNEELQSANEELRSTLEELETSKEELQSMNEELQTVNQENRNKVDELSELSDDLQNLLAATDVPTLFLDRYFRILRFTPMVTRLFNVRMEDRGRPLSDLTNSLNYDELIADARHVLDSLVPVEREMQDAAGAWYFTRVRPYRSGRDTIDGVVITFFDISARKRDEEALLASERRLEAQLAATLRLHELVAQIMVSDDLHSALDKVLVATLEITGATMGNVQLVDPASGALSIEVYRNVDEALLDHFRAVTRDDNTACGKALRWRRSTVVEDVQADAGYAGFREEAARAGYRGVICTPLLSHEQNLLGILTTHFAQPVMTSERELRLLDIYSRQTAEVVEHMRRREAVAELDHRKDSFLAMLGHELRNPLAAIRNSLEIVRKRPADMAGNSHFNEVVERQSRTLTRLVDDLLQISRINQAKVQLRPVPLALSTLVAHAAQESQSEAQAGRHRLTLALAAPGPWVQGDPVRLTQVVTNLLSNAWRYTPPGGDVRVATYADGDSAVISVRDAGIGIPGDQLAHIFDMFYQVAQREISVQDGLGIGLALVKSLVELHGGTIEARSDGANLGSEFIVRLPLAAPVVAATDTDAATDTGVAAAVRPLRILVVDDEPDQAMSLAELLRIMGHEVRTASDGEDGLIAAREFLPHAALLDISLPKMNGYELAGHIRREPWGAGMLLIAQTGRTREQDRARSREAGFDHHLTKPFELADLEQLLAAGKAPS